MQANETTLLGVTLRTSQRHPSSLAVLDHRSHLVHLGPFYTDDELLEMAQTCQPALIAIGSPLCLPAGLANLEPSCDTIATPPENRGRQLERELASMGISCFFTGRGSVIRRLIERGIGLKGLLSHLGHEVIEVYPHATRVILFGDEALARRSSRSVAFMKEKLPSLINEMEHYADRLDKYTGDSLLNAYVALLHMREGTDQLGDPQEGLLVIPKLPR